MKYLTNHWNQFTFPNVAYTVALMQFWGGLFTEGVNLGLICCQSTVLDTMLNFIALGAIAEIDNYYANSIAYSAIGKQINDGNLPKFDSSTKALNK